MLYILSNFQFKYTNWKFKDYKLKIQGRSPKFKDFSRKISFSRTFQGKPKIQGLFKDCGNHGHHKIVASTLSHNECLCLYNCRKKFHNFRWNSLNLQNAFWVQAIWEISLTFLTLALNTYRHTTGRSYNKTCKWRGNDKTRLAEQTENLVINKTSTNKGQYQSNIWQVL